MSPPPGRGTKSIRTDIRIEAYEKVIPSFAQRTVLQRPGADVAQFTESISFDRRLWRHDIVGSMAHATMLRKIGVLNDAELKAIIKGLDAIGHEIKSGKFRWKPELEDVHMNIEAELTRRVPAGAKLHTGRSRNDQIAAGHAPVAAGRNRRSVEGDPRSATCAR